MNFFDHKDLENHLLQLCLKVVKHPVCMYVCMCVYVCVYMYVHMSVCMCVSSVRLPFLFPSAGQQNGKDECWKCSWTEIRFVTA